MEAPLISTGTLTRQSLAGQVALVSGAGGGIGFETARALIWLGAKVIIAEIDRKSGKYAEKIMNSEFGAGSAWFQNVDVSDESQISYLQIHSLRRYGRVDIVINNATVAPLGAVLDVEVREWDSSYRVNLRGPALMARAFLPGMVERGSGVFLCVSSLGQEYMAVYESLKAAQVHLGNTLSVELEDTGVSVFSVGPGYVPTKTARESIPRLAAMMGKTTDELFDIVKPFQISVEAAGAGLAAAAAMGERYHGQEISAVQALTAAGIELPEAGSPQEPSPQPTIQFSEALALCRKVHTTLDEQSAGWKERSIFEQQWMKRTFRSRSGMPADQWLAALGRLEAALEAGACDQVAEMHLPLDKLAGYYAHLHEMAKDYIKDPAQREEQLAIVRGWQTEVLNLEGIIHPWTRNFNRKSA